MPIRLAIVDGHTLTRYGMRELIAQQPDIEIVAESGSATEAPIVVGRARPDVVTVDVALPDGNGLRLAFVFNDRETTEIYALSLPDALPSTAGLPGCTV